MKTTAASNGSSQTAKTAGSAHTASNSNSSSSNNNNNNNNRNAKNSSHALSSPSGSNVTSSAGQKARGVANGRVGSAKYYDIASTILGGSGDLETVFLNAAKNGNTNKLEQMLSQTGHAALDIDCKDKRTGNTALMWAAKRGHSKVVELLLQHGADPTLCNYEAQTALELGFSPLKTILLDWVDTDLPMTSLLLLQAAWQGNLAVVHKILTTKGAKDINCQNAEGLTPLMLVSRDVQLFERMAVQLNRLYSPVEVAEELIKAGADIHATDNDGRSSLHYVSQSRAGVADRLVSTLITGGMDPELRDKRLFAPIHLASQVGNTNNVIALVDGGSEVNIQGFAGLTPLHITAYNDHQRTTVTLLDHGADVRVTDDRGLTPLDLAKTRKMKMTLKEAWAEVSKDKDEQSKDNFPTHVVKDTGNSVVRSKSDSAVRKKNSTLKKKPEVIFDGLIINETKESPMQTNALLNTVERCKQTEKKILEDLEILKAAHPILQKENSRILGTTRTKILPQIGHTTSPQHSRHSSPDRSNQVVLLAGEEIRRSWEESRQLLISRGRSVSDIKLGIGRHSRLASLSSYDGDLLVIDDARESLTSRGSPVVFNPSVPPTPKHHRSGSDPMCTSMADIAASCDNFIPNSRAKRNGQAIPMSSNASRVIPPASTFITQPSDMSMEQKRKSLPQEDKFIQAMASPLELLRCRSMLKEDFILEESRPSEMPSGSDPASSTSSLSSSSPRDSNCVPHSPLRSHKVDPSFTALSELQETEAENKSNTKTSQVMWKINHNQNVRPLIIEPQRRIRRNSDNSSSTESFNHSRDFANKTDPSPNIQSGKNLVKSQNVIKTSKSLNCISKGSLISKSQSLESLSPRTLADSTSDRKVMNENMISRKSFSTSSDLSSSTHKQTSTSGRPDPGAYTRKLSSKEVEVKSDEKTLLSNQRSQQRSRAAPFSGKARIIQSTELDKWDSLNSQRDERLSDQWKDQQDYVFVPVKSSNEPRKSGACQIPKANGQVTKSCTDAALEKQSQQNKTEERRPKTSSNESDSTSQKQAPTRTVVQKIKSTQETKIVLKNQSPPKEKSNDTARSIASKSTANALQTGRSSTSSFVNKGGSKVMQDFKKSADPAKKVNTPTSQPKSLSVPESAQTERRPAGGSKNLESTTAMPGDGNSKSEVMEPSEGCFMVTEESMRLGSASKVRMQEKLSTMKQKKVGNNEKEMLKIKKADETTPAMSKTKSVSRAAQIEKSIRKNQTQNSVTQRSTASSQNFIKSESNATNKKLSNSSETSISGVARTFSTTNVFKTNSESSASQTKASQPPETAKEKQTSPAVVDSNKTHSTAKSIETNRETASSGKLTKTAKALDPHVILTPRSTEPLVKIKFDSSSNPQPAKAPPAIQNPPVTVISTPLIVNPFEGFPQNRNPESDNSTKDAIVKLKKAPTKYSNKTVKKSSSVNKRPNSGSSRKTSSAGKRRGAKSKDTKDENHKEGRIRSSKKGSKSSKKKLEAETTETELTAEAAKTDVALISGIGWQLSTSCINTSDVKVAKRVNFHLSSTAHSVTTPNDIEDDQFNDDNNEDMNSDKRSDMDDLECISELMPSPRQYDDDDNNNNLDVLGNSDVNHDNKALEVFKEKITLNSPRFQEMKRRQESQLNFDLPVVTNDGFPPMNLDITQRVTEFNNVKDVEDKYYENPKLKMNNHLIQREILMDKLTPIPEASFVSKTVSAISQFDRSMQGDKLSELLEDSSPPHAQLQISKKKSADICKSAKSKRDKSFDKKAANYEYTSSGKAIRRSQSMKDTRQIGRVPRERTFSETKSFDHDGEEESIEEAIEEILSSTISSNASTLKGNSQVPYSSCASATHSLTDGDKNVLKKLKSTCTDSPFHATPAIAVSRSLESPLPSPLLDILDVTSPSKKSNDAHYDGSHATKNVDQSSQIDLLQKAQPVSNTSLKMSSLKEKGTTKTAVNCHETHGKMQVTPRLSFNQSGTQRSNPTLRRATSMRDMNSKAKNPLEKESSRDKVEITEEEAKQLARVMSSLRHMELHTGSQLSSLPRDSFGGSAKIVSKTKKAEFSSTSITHSASLAVRPSSTGATAGKLKGKFHELKDDGSKPHSSVSNRSNQASGMPQEKILNNQNKDDKGTLLAPDDGALVVISRPESVSSSVADAAEIENFYLDLTVRRGSLAGSECTIDSAKSEDDTIQWKKGNVLGRGAFGTVWCGLTNEGELIAVKQIELTTMDQGKAQREYEKIQEEVELLKTLEHINIVGYLGTSLEDNIVSIFMQFIPGGSLASILARFGALDETVFRRYTKQILEGVNYLHDNDVIHRDLKGANVMLMPTGVIKLIDFGCAKRLCINLNLSQTEILKSMKGTPYWMAPEVVNETGHGKKSDIWSIGCTVFEMATRKPPWADMNPMAAIFAIGSAERPVPDLPEKFSPEAVAFVSLCLTRDQEKRPSASELLNHSFISRKNGRKVTKVNNDNSSEC